MSEDSVVPPPSKKHIYKISICLPIMTCTSRNNPIQPIFKLPKGGRKLVECLPIIIKKISKFGIAEFYISPATCQKFDIND